MTYQQRLIWSLIAGLALAGLFELFVVYGWVSGHDEATPFGRWQLIMLIAAAGAVLVWFFHRDALESGGDGSAATPTLVLGALSVASLPVFSLGFFSVLSVAALNYGYTVITVGPVPSQARKAYLGTALAVVGLIAGAVLCITATWRLLP
jgi:hypothetical protein